MVAIVSGAGLGLSNGSLNVLGPQGAVGQANQGRAGEGVYVNSATGNLVVQNRDEVVIGRGPDLGLLRTYNSQGLLNDDNGDNWRLGVYRRVYNLTGTVNSAGGTVTRVAEDGSESVYSFDASLGKYVGHDGAGAYDTLSFDGATQIWTWTDGDSRITERYDAANGGRLAQVLDPDGNGLTFTYNAAGLITQVSDASGETTFLDYTGNNLTQLRTVTSDGQTLIRTRYAYDTSNRLIQVITDLSPEDASIADGKTYTITYTYDGTSKRIASISQSDGTTVSFTYVQVGVDWKVKTFTDALGHKTTLDYVTDSQSTQTANANQTALITTDTQTNSVTRSLNSTLLQTTVPYNLNSSQLQTTDTIPYGLNSSLLQTTDTVPYTLNSSLLKTTDTVPYTLNSALLQTTDTISGNLNSAALTAPSWGGTSLLESSVTAAITPAAGFDGAGNGFAVWAQDNHVYARRYVGNAWGQQVTLDSLNVAADSANLFVDASGNAVASWSDGSGRAWVSRYVNGFWLGAELLGDNGCKFTYATINASGRMAASWYTYDPVTKAFKGINAGIFVPGIGWLPTTTISSTPPGKAEAGIVNTAIDSSGNAVIVYSTNNAIFAKVYNVQLQGWQAATQLGTYGASDYAVPQVGFDGAGKATAIWSQNGAITYRSYDGSNWSGTSSLAPSSAGSFSSFRLNVDPSGKAIATWNDSVSTWVARYVGGAWQGSEYMGSSNSLSGIYPTENASINASGQAVVIRMLNNDVVAKRYTPGGGWSADTVLDALTTNPSRIGVDIDSRGNILTSWVQSDGADSIYSRYYDANPYYTVGSGATWSSIASTLYGSAILGNKLQTALGNPALTVGKHLTGFPATLSDTTTVAPYYRVQAGDTWSSIAAYLYGSANVSDELQTALGNPALTAGAKLTNIPTTLNDTVSVPPYYRIQAGDTWSSIAAYLFGSSNVGDELQAALGNPALTAGGKLTNLPGTLNDTITVAPYYRVQAGDTWSSIAGYLYGSANVGDELQAALGNPALTAGLRLAGIPATLNDTIIVAPYYRVLAGDTWPSIAATLYGSANVGDELQIALGSPALTAGLHLVNMPGVLNDRVAPYYTVGAGDSWSSIAAYLYGNADVAAEVQSALGNPALIAGSRLTNLPASLTHTWLTPIPPYYLVQQGDTLTNIAALIYGTPEAASALQAAMGNPALTAGLHLTVPSTLSYTRTLRAHLDITDPLGLVTVLAYDGSGQVTSVTGPAVGSVSQVLGYTYDSNGNVTQVTDARGNVIAYDYDASGNRVLERDAAGNTVTRVYGSKNELLAETRYLVPDPDGAGAAQPASPLTTRYAYDANDHLRFVVSAEGRVTEFRYNGFGQRVASIQCTGALYDLTGLTPASALPEANLTAWLPVDRSASMRTDTSYDFRGQVASTTSYLKVDAAGNGVADGTQAVTQYIYDQAGNLLKTLDARGAATAYVYDGLRRMLSTTDALGRATLTQYDDANRKTVLTLANGLVTTSTYDAAGDLISVLQGANSQALGTTSYFYDANGRLRRTEDPTGIKTHILYDEAGRKIGTIDGAGSLTEYRYNANGDVTKTIHYATAVSAASLASLIDLQGKPTSVTLAAIRPAASADDRISWNAYDAADRLVKSVDEAGFVTQRFYDGAGRLTDVLRFATAIGTALLPDAPQPGNIAPATDAADRLTRNFYDGQGKLRGTLDGEGYLVEYKYDAAGQSIETVGYATATDSSLRASGTLAQLIPAAGANDIHSYTIYNARGQVAGTVDGEGYLTEYVYDAAGNKTQVVRYATKVTYTAGATLASLRPAADSQDHVSSSTYTALNQLASQTSFEGTLIQHSYDEAGNLTQTVKAVNTSDVRGLTAQYDKQGRLTAELSGKGSALLAGAVTQADIDAIWAANAIHYSYDASGRRTSTTDPNGNKTLFYYDSDGRLTQAINAAGEVKENRYDALGQLAQTITYGTRLSSATLGTLSGGLVDTTLTSAVAGIANAMLDSSTSYSYTVRGQVASTTDPLAFVTTRAYDAFGEAISGSQQIGSGQTLDHTYTFDKRGLLTQTVWDPTGINSSETTVYDAFGRATQTTDANGNLRTRSYDRLGRAVATTVDPGTGHLNLGTSTTFDAFDRLLTQTDALGNVTTYSYDTANRSVTVTTPEGIVTTIARNRQGETQSITDGRNNTTTYTYDLDGNLTRVNAPLGAGSEIKAYDKADLLTEVTDANGVKTAYTYDAANRVLTRRVDPTGLNLTTNYAYDDAKGHITSVTDARGVVTQTGFDLKGQVASVTVDPGTGHLNLTTTYAYDGRGKTVTVTEGDGSAQPRVTKYTYDKLGRRVQEQIDPAGLNLATSYAYDKNNNLVAKTDALGNFTRYVYDGDDRLVYTIDPLGDVSKSEYDAAGRVTKTIAYANTLANLVTLPAAPTASDITTRLSTSPSDETLLHVYDKDGRERYTIDALGEVTWKDYDADGNVIDRIGYANTIPTGTAATVADVDAALALAADPAHDSRLRTVYDALNRAVFSIDAAGFVSQHTYDANGNVVKEVQYANALQGSFLPDVAPQVVAVAPASGSYVIADATRDRITRQIYDAAGRMRYGVDAEGYVTERRLDALGHEIQRIRYADRIAVADGATVASVAALLPSAVPASAALEEAHYDNAGRLFEVVDGEGVVTRNLYDALGNKTDVIRAFGTNAASTKHYVYDASGRVVEETAGFGSAVAATTRYALDAFGNRKKITDPRGVELAESDSAWALQTRQALGYVDGLGNAKVASALTLAEKDALRARYSTTQEFDALGRKTRSIDALGGITDTAYDAFGDAVKVTDPRGNIGYFYFNARNQAVLHVDPEGYVSQSVYDAFGNLTQTIRYANKVVGTVSAAQGPAIVTAAPASGPYVLADTARDRIATTQYDLRDKQIQITDAEGYYEQFTYDAFGNKVTSRNKLGGVTSYIYDRAGHMLSETLPITSLDALGQSAPVVNRYEYDARGNRTRQVEAFGLPEQRVTLFEYDKLDRQTRKIGEAVHVFDTTALAVTGVASPVEQSRYDARGNLIETIGANGARTLLYCDALDRKIAQVDALGALTVWQYNSGPAPTAELGYADAVALPASAGGTPPAPVNASNLREKRFTFDANNALVETRIPNMLLGEQAIGASAFSVFSQDVVTKSVYDAAGNEVQAIDARGNSSFCYYNRLGQKILEVDPEKYVTRWEYDAAGNVIRTTQYANKLSLTAAITSDVAALIANAGASSDDRVTELDYDRLGRVTERRVLNVQYGTVDANGVLASGSAGSRTRFQYNGLGQVIQQTDANGAVTDLSYDAAGRRLREQDAQFTDFEGAEVRPTTDFEYDGLNQVKRQLVRGKDNTTEMDDRVTVYQYDYGFGARLAGQTDPTLSTTSFFYDMAGDIVHKSLNRSNADGASVLDRTTFSYDALKRETARTDLATNQTNETRYDLYGEIIGKRTNGGGLGGTWQEVTEYDKLGRAWKSNAGDGVFKAYLDDANGNATLTIQSAGPDFSALTLDQVMALAADQKFLTIGQYDARNKLVGTWQPKMSTLHDQAAIEQFLTQSTGTVFSGGAVSVGAMGNVFAKPKTDPVATGAVGITSRQTITYSISDTLVPSVPGVFGPYHQISLTLTFPVVAGLGAGNYRVQVTDPIYLVTTNYSFPGDSTPLNISYALSIHSSPLDIKIYKETAYGPVYLSGGSLAFSGNASGVVGSTTSESGTLSTINLRLVHFQSQSPSTNLLILQYRPAGSNEGWRVFEVPQFSTLSGPVAGWYAFDWTAWGRGTYEIRYTALDAAGNVLNSESGTMVLSDTAPSTISQTPQQFGGPGRAFSANDGKLHILEQGSSAQTLTVRYRRSGSSGAWTAVALTPMKPTTPGWFALDTIAKGMSGSYDYWIEAKAADGSQVNKALGFFTAFNANSVSALTAYQDLPEMVHFLSQPASAASMKLSYRPSGSTGAYTTLFLAKVGTGAFDWDATSLVIDRLANYDYEYQYETFDAGNALVNKAHGVLQLGANPAMLSHVSDSTPTFLSFNPPQANATKLVLQYRNADSIGAYASVALTRASGAQSFTWDASAVVPPGITGNLEYSYDLYDSADATVLAVDGTPVHVMGVLAIGATSAPTELKWVIVGSSNAERTIHRQQTYNAFGQVAQEIDGLTRATDFRYNHLGLLIEKRDPETDITLANGFIQRGRPTTSYTYDLGGRLAAVKDANGNTNTQQLLPGSGLSGETPRVLTEFHADFGRKRTAYDVFGDARTLTDEIDRVTVQEFDKLGRLTKVIHSARAANTPGNATAATVSAVDIYAYDQAGNRISHKNADTKTEKTYYDSLGRVTQTTSALGLATTYAYTYDNTIAGAGGKQVGGWVKTTTDPTGRTIQDKQNLFGRLVSHKDLGDHLFTYTYNYAGWLTTQTGSTGQNILYDYYANGYLKAIDDRATGAYTKYEYDVEGNRTLEAFLRNAGSATPEYYEFAEVTYDELNRVKRVLDPKAEIRYEYDANDNRRRVWSYYHDGVDGTPSVQDYWYAYDTMNRFVVTMGGLSGGGARGASATDPSVSVVKGSTGVDVFYDAASERKIATYGSDGRREDYTYTADGYLEDTSINGVLRARRFNDLLGRVVKYQEYDAAGSPSFGRASSYNDDNKLLSQTEYTGAVGGTVKRSVTYDYIDAPGTLNNAGPLLSTSTSEPDPETGTTTVNSYYGYDWWDSAKEKTVTSQPFNPNMPGWLPGYSNFEYDVNGHLKQVDDPLGGRAIRYTNDAQGQILIRDEISGGTANAQGVVTGAGTIDKHHSFYYLNGHRIGDVGNDGPLQISYAEELARDKNVSRRDANRNWQPISSADFDQNFEPINSSYPAATSSLYTVRSGDTLRSIAAAMWGDASLWYLIADANGLTDTTPLVAGQTLTIPNKVTNIHNSSQTFKVYSPGEAIGDTSPTLPDAPPAPFQEEGCGLAGMVIIIIVVIVVTIYTAGATSELLAPAAEAAAGEAAVAGAAAGGAAAGGTAAGGAAAMGTWEAGLAALGGQLGWAGFAGAVVGGAAGSIAGQGLAIGMGMQDEFSWKQVGMSAIGAGVTAGIGAYAGEAGLASKVGLSQYLGSDASLAFNAMAGNIATQGIGRATGWQESFSWRSVAVSALAAPLADRVGDAVQGEYGFDDYSGRWSRTGTAYSRWVGDFGARLTTSLVSGVGTQLVRRRVYGKGELDYGQIAGDAFGNTLGTSLATQLARNEAAAAQALANARANPVGLMSDSGQYLGTSPELDAGYRMYRTQGAVGPTDLGGEWAALAGGGFNAGDVSPSDGPPPGTIDARKSSAGDAAQNEERDRIRSRLTSNPLPDGTINVRNPPTADGRFDDGTLDYRGGRAHLAVDLAAPVGTTIVGAGDGRAVVTQSPGYGNLVEIYHDDGIVTRYGHMDTFSIANGTRVSAGQPIGTVGTTGNVPLGAQPHLHFEVVRSTTYINPATIFNWQ